MPDVGCRTGVHGNSVPSARFCCEPETALWKRSLLEKHSKDVQRLGDRAPRKQIEMTKELVAVQGTSCPRKSVVLRQSTAGRLPGGGGLGGHEQA